MTHADAHSEPGDDRAIYGLEEVRHDTPDLGGDVVVATEADEVIDHIAADLVLHAENCVREFGDFQLALSGGPLFEPLYTRLMYDPNYRRLPWRRTHLWLVEECCVPFHDERSHYRMINEIVGDHADIPADQLHVLFAESETAVEEYEAQIREALAWREKGQDRLDYVLLTMGADGGTAGLGPGSVGSSHPAETTFAAVADERVPLVRRHPSPGGDHPARVAMTLPFLNAARFVAVYVTGAEMAAPLRRLAGREVTSVDMPMKGVAPVHGELKWYLDGPACGAHLGDGDER
jgi:6-phosphogluconolactonase/glucosamine-6-phosphate isomerase/deaminase